MKFKNDLEMWHKYAEFAKHLQKVAEFQEMNLYMACMFHQYDKGACEEYCSCPNIQREKDFEAKEECWQCSSFKMKVDQKEAESKTVNHT